MFMYVDKIIQNNFYETLIRVNEDYDFISKLLKCLMSQNSHSNLEIHLIESDSSSSKS